MKLISCSPIIHHGTILICVVEHGNGLAIIGLIKELDDER